MKIIKLLKKFHTKLENMCRWENCTEPHCCTIMGTKYCEKHMQAVDVMWEKIQQGDPDEV